MGLYMMTHIHQKDYSRCEPHLHNELIPYLCILTKELLTLVLFLHNATVPT